MNPLAAMLSHLDESGTLGAPRTGVFDSSARNARRTDSEVDLHVEIEENHPTCDNFYALRELLEQLLNRRLDLVSDMSRSQTKARVVLPPLRYPTSHG